MTGLVFVDTNVLVYARDAGAGEKHDQAATWMLRLWEEGRGRTGFQVLQEFYVTVTQKLRPGLDRETAREEVRHLLAWRPSAITRIVMEEGWRVQDRYGLSWWDALIVAAARQAGCRYLLTEDLQDGQDLDGLGVVNPFAHGPEVL